MNNLLKITGIIDPTKNLVLGLSKDVKATEDREGKARDLNSIYIVLQTTIKREYTGPRKEVDPVRSNLPNNDLERALMLKRMAAKGVEFSDYSIRKQNYFMKIEKDMCEEVFGTSYEDLDLNTLLNQDANEVVTYFKERPARVRVDEVDAETYDSLPEKLKKAYQKKENGEGVLLKKDGQQIYRATYLDAIDLEIEDNFLDHDAIEVATTTNAKAGVVEEEELAGKA